MRSKMKLKLIALLMATFFAFSLSAPVLAQEGGGYTFNEDSGISETAKGAGSRGGEKSHRPGSQKKWLES